MYKQIDKLKEKNTISVGQCLSRKRNGVKQASALINNQPKNSVWENLKSSRTLQMGGAERNPDAPKNYESIGYGIKGVLDLRDNVDKAKEPDCHIGVMARYPIGKNYYMGKGGHAAFQVEVNLGDGKSSHQYLQVGVSATGSIQAEPIFQTIKTKEGYNIKRATKKVTKDVCSSSLTTVAKEIATEQPYKERIFFNTGSYTNCALWASKMAKQAGMDLGLENTLVLPSPNELQNKMTKFYGKNDVKVHDETEISGGEEIAANVGLEPLPQVDENGNIIIDAMGENKAKEYIMEVGGDIR